MRIFKRTGVIAAALLLAVILLVATQATHNRVPSYTLNDFRSSSPLPTGHKPPAWAPCTHNGSEYETKWRDLKDKHNHRVLDKFTYVPHSY